MGHRKWTSSDTWPGWSQGQAEHNALYDAYKNSEKWRMECLDENNRLDRELDEARKRIAELESPLRVPFSDDQIERIAKAHMGVISPCANWEHADKQYYMNAIRAALAAGGLEPCADPADVALRPADDAWKTPLEVKQIFGKARAYTLENTAVTQYEDTYIYFCPADAARMAAWLSSYAAAHGVVTHKRNPANSYFEGDPKPADDEVEKLARVLRETHAKTCGKVPDAYELDGFRNDARAATAHLSYRPDGLPTTEELEVLVRNVCRAGGDESDIVKALTDAMRQPTGHVLRDRLVEAERKVENQRAELKRLNALVAELRDAVDDNNTNAAAVNDLLVQVQNLTAERDALRDRDTVPVRGRVDGYDFTEYELDKWMQQELNWSTTPEKAVKIMNYMAAHAHAVIDVPAGVPSVPSVPELIGVARNARPDYAIDSAQVTAIRDRILSGLAQPSSNAVQFDTDEVEALARVMRAQYWGEDRWDGEMLNANKEDWLGVARAAIAHLRKRPEGLPTREQMAKISYDASPSVAYMGGNFVKWEKLSGGQQNIYIARADAILAALTPYLRDPVGKPELDVTAEQLAEAMCEASAGEGAWKECFDKSQHLLEANTALDLCRSRIRPTYECKECANWKAHAAAIEDSSFDMIKRINLARAALEGE